MVSVGAFPKTSARTKISHSPENARTSCQTLPFLIQYLSGGTRLLYARWAAGQVSGERESAMLLSCMRVYSLQTEHLLYISTDSVCLLIPSLGGLALSSFATLVAFADLLVYRVYCGIN